jgi:hypothetical protein
MKNLFKQFQKAKKTERVPQDKSVKRPWGNAARLEHINNRGKGRLDKKGK